MSKIKGDKLHTNTNTNTNTNGGAEKGTMQRDRRCKRRERKSCNNLVQVHAAAGLLCTAKGGSPGQCSMEHTAAAAAEIPKYKNSQIQKYTVKEGESDPGQCSMEHTSASCAAAEENSKKEIQSWSHYRTVFCILLQEKSKKRKIQFLMEHTTSAAAICNFSV